MAVRLKDIAQDLGLSVVTISKVLRDHPDIGEVTRKRVLKRMRELNYQPNFAARSLITGRTWTMGLIVPDLQHPLFAQLAKIISIEAQRKGYGLFISSSENDPDNENKEISYLLARRVDVLLIATSQATTESFQQIKEQKIPYILLNRQFADHESNFVGTDDAAIGALATEHLIEQGCRRIAFICGAENGAAIGRMKGYRQALAAHQIEPLPGYISSAGLAVNEPEDKTGYSATAKLLANKKRPEGIFCCDDSVALGAMNAIMDAGLRVPEDVAVVGCGNLSNSEYFRVPLTSVDLNCKMIGKYTASLAVKLAQSKGAERIKSTMIPPELVVRASSLKWEAGAHSEPAKLRLVHAD